MSENNLGQTPAGVKKKAPKPGQHTGTFNDVLAAFTRAYESHAEQTPYNETKFNAIAVWVGTLERSVFEKKYDKDFVEFILKKNVSGRVDATPVLEILFFAPEVSGCLPTPDMATVSKHLQDYSYLDPEKLYEQAKKSKLQGLSREISRLDRLPRAYMLVSDGPKPKSNSKIQVTFPYDYDFTHAAITRIYG